MEDFERLESAESSYVRANCRRGVTLGSGSFGYVESFIQDNPQPISYARKVLQKSKTDSKEMRNELASIRLAKHHHTILIVDEDEDAENYYIVMLPCARRTLETHLQWYQNQTHTESEYLTQGRDRVQLFRWMYCLATTVLHLHDTIGVRHRDIKPKNLLIGNDSFPTSQAHASPESIYIADFGLSFASEEATRNTLTKARGTPRYLPPEGPSTKQLRENERVDRWGRAGDIFSLGGVFLEILHAICYRLDTQFPQDYPPALAKDGPYRNVVDKPSFYEKVKEVNITEEKLSRLPARLQFAGLTEDLIDYTVSHMVVQQDSRHKAAQVVQNLRSIMHRQGVLLASCCDEHARWVMDWAGSQTQQQLPETMYGVLWVQLKEKLREVTQLAIKWVLFWRPYLVSKGLWDGKSPPPWTRFTEALTQFDSSNRLGPWAISHRAEELLPLITLVQDRASQLISSLYSTMNLTRPHSIYEEMTDAQYEKQANVLTDQVFNRPEFKKIWKISLCLYWNADTSVTKETIREVWDTAGCIGMAWIVIWFAEAPPSSSIQNMDLTGLADSWMAKSRTAEKESSLSRWAQLDIDDDDDAIWDHRTPELGDI